MVTVQMRSRMLEMQGAIQLRWMALETSRTSGHGGVPGIQNATDMTADTKETINTHNAPQTQNLPVKAGRHNQVEPRSCADMLIMCTDTHGMKTIRIRLDTHRNV